MASNAARSGFYGNIRVKAKTGEGPIAKNKSFEIFFQLFSQLAGRIPLI